MAVIGNILIGMLVDNSKLKRGFDNSRGIVKSAGAGLSNVLAGAFAGFTAAAAVHEIFSVVEAASALNEQISGTGAVFKESADVVTSAAQEMADKFGIVKTEYLKGATGLGALGKASGQTEAEAAGLAVTMTDLAADLSSFRDVGFDEALLAIRSGLAGESEPLRKFGVLLSENAVKAEAARLGIARMGATLTEAQKVQARSSLITKGLADAHGDLAKTSDSVGNRIRELSGRIENFKADAGGAFDSVSRAITGGLAEAIQGLSGSMKENQNAIKAWADEAVKAGGIINNAITGTGKAIAGVVDATSYIGIAWNAVGVTVRAVAAHIVDEMAQLVKGIDWVLAALGKGATGYATVLDELSKELKKRAQGDADALKAAFGGGPAAGGGVQNFFNNLANGAAAAAGATATAAKEMTSLSDAQLKVAADVAGLTEKLREQVQTFGMSGDEAAIYKLQLQGATAAELQEAMSLTQVAKAQEHYKDLQSEAQSLIEAGMSPLEKYQQELRKIEELKAAGLITDAQGANAANLAKKDLAGGETGATHASALEMGSSEARSAILKFQNKSSDEPIKAVADNTKQQLVETKNQGVTLKDMATKLGDIIGQKTTDILAGAF